MNRLFCGLLLILWFHVSGVYGQSMHKNPVRLSSLNFIPNQGQIADRNYQPRPDVLFQVEGKGVYVRENGITLVLTNADEVWHEAHEKMEEVEHSEEGLGEHDELEWQQAFMQQSKINVHQVSMTFLNANEKIEVDKSLPSSDYLNYYLPQCLNGVAHVHTYKSIDVQNIYKGISVNYYGNANGELEYDIHIAPYANPNQLQLNWTGAEDVSVQSDGRLKIKTKIRDLYESLPSVYQLVNNDTVKIQAQYNVENVKDGSFTVSYLLGNYDKSSALIIDPWVTNYGGLNLDLGRNVTTDYSGNVIMVGATVSNSAIAEDGFVDTITGGTDAFIVKFNEVGVRIWGTYYGGELDDACNSVAADINDNIFVCGTTLSESAIANLGFQNDFGGAIIDWLFTYGDLFLAKFNSDGVRIWATYYGGEGGEVDGDVFVGDDGSVYLTGSTGSLEGIASADGYQTTYGGGGLSLVSDAFLVKFTNDGDREWATYYGGSSGDSGFGVASDRENNIYLCGNTASTDGISTPMSYQDFWAGNSDAFLVKFNEVGDRIWATYFGGNAFDYAMDIDCDTLNNVYVTGYTESPDNIAFGGYQMEHGGVESPEKRDAFLVQFNPTGSRIWSTYLGGNQNDYAISIDVDKKTNNVAISGDVYSENLPVSVCAFQPERIGLENAFIAQFQTSGELFCSSYFGADHEENTKMAFGGCYLYLVGSTLVELATPGAHQESLGGARDAFLAQIYKNSCGIELPIMLVSTTFEDVTDCRTCDGEISIQVSIEGCTSHVNYIWSTGDQYLNSVDTSSTITDLCAGSYWVLVEQSCVGMSDTLFFELGGEFNLTHAEFEAEDACLGEAVTFVNLSTTDEGEIVSYQWDFGDLETSSEENPSHFFDEAGTYIVVLTVENSSNCSDTVYHEITIFPTYNLEESFSVCSDTLFTFPDGVQQVITEYTVHTTSSLTINGCDSIISTIIDVKDANLVFDTIIAKPGELVHFPSGDSLIIEVNQVDTAHYTNHYGCDSTVITFYLLDDFIFIPPNIFSPDEDGANDTFFFPQKHVTLFNCAVVNRWGVVVFEFDSIASQWDGLNQKNGKPCPDGVYFFTYDGTTIFNTTFSGQGTVQLVRE